MVNQPKDSLDAPGRVLKRPTTVNATLRTLALDSNGILRKETTPGTLSAKPDSPSSPPPKVISPTKNPKPPRLPKSATPPSVSPKVAASGDPSPVPPAAPS